MTWWVGLLLSPAISGLVGVDWAILVLHTFAMCPRLLQKWHTSDLNRHVD